MKNFGFKSLALMIFFCMTASATNYRLGVYGRPNWNGGLEVEYITDHNGIAAACGIGAGDVVLSIGGRSVNTPQQAIDILDDLDANGVSGFYITYRSPSSPMLKDCHASRPNGGGGFFFAPPPMNN